MSGSGDAVGGGGALASATGTAEGGSEAAGGGQTNLYPVDVAAKRPDAWREVRGEDLRATVDMEKARFESRTGRKPPDATFTGNEQSYQGFEVREVEALPIDYNTMHGAEFQRAVGVDPEKWAAAFVRRTGAEMSEAEIAERVAYVAGWFRGAMDAARKDRWLPCQPVSTSS